MRTECQQWVCLVMPRASWWKIMDALALEDTQDSGDLQKAVNSIKRTELTSKRAIKRVLLACEK